MKVLELFAGTRSIGRAFAGGGHDVYSIEWDDSFPDISWYMDISKITSADILERFGKPDVIWASPDCTTYSIAGISHHRVQEPNGNLAPVSEYAKFCDTLNRHVLKLISELQPTFWFIENPRGGMPVKGVEIRYFDMLAEGCTPQEARSVLPNSLKTEMVMTANIREWRHFLKLRCSPAAHPQMREVALILLDKVHALIPVCFDDIWSEYHADV